MNHDEISSGINSQAEGINSLLEEASLEARRILSSIQALAGTTACKGVQIHGLKKWALSKGCWINRECLGVYSDRGSENEVYTKVEESIPKLEKLTSLQLLL